MLKIDFLGTLKIESEGMNITDKLSSKSQALIAILMTKKRLRCSRKELIGYLWPESSEEAAKYNLRFNLWQLRKTICVQPSGQPFLIITRDDCQINEKYSYQCDFRQIIEADVENCDIGRLEELRCMFRGDFFENRYFSDLEEFEELMIMQRYILENKKQVILKRLMELYRENKEIRKCLDIITDLETMDPYDEKNAEIKISLLLEEGQRSEAARFYQKFYNRMVYDIGMEPPERLKNLIGGFAEVRKKDEKIIDMTVEAIPSVDAFFMAQTAEKLSEFSELSLPDYLDSGQIKDLAFITRKLGAASQTGVPFVRVVSAFMELIIGICRSDFRICLRFDSWENVDRMSKDVLKLLKNKLGESLILICSDQ